MSIFKKAKAKVQAAYHKEIAFYKSDTGKSLVTAAGMAVGVPPQVTNALYMAGGDPMTAANQQQGQQLFDYFNGGGNGSMPSYGTNVMKNSGRQTQPVLRSAAPSNFRRAPAWG